MPTPRVHCHEACGLDESLKISLIAVHFRLVMCNPLTNMRMTRLGNVIKVTCQN